MDIKKLWNNRIFRTFLQAAISAGCAAFIDSKPIAVIVVIAVATGLSKIMPLIDEGADQE
jgi:hypothetical protein